MVDGKRIKDLSERELIELIQQTIKGNHIAVFGVEVNSTTESLKQVEETIDRLLKKHNDYLLLRRELKIKTNMGD